MPYVYTNQLHMEKGIQTINSYTQPFMQKSGIVATLKKQLHALWFQKSVTYENEIRTSFSYTEAFMQKSHTVKFT